MSQDKRLRDVDLENPTYIIVAGHDQMPAVEPLKIGASVFVGSGSNCRIALKDETVKQIHCMLWLEDGNVLKVQDWNSGSTYLNDMAVTDETVVRSGDVLTIGHHRLTAVLDRDFHFGMAVELLNGADQSVVTPVDVTVPQKEPAQVDNAATATVAASKTSTVGFQLGVDLPPQVVADAPDTANASQAGFQYDIDADLDSADDTFDSSQGGFAIPHDVGFAFGESCTDDEDSILRVEIEQLRFELAQRDAQLESLHKDQPSPSVESMVSEQEVVKLVSRLEDLLAELKDSDNRINGLEDLLRLSDQATAAEKEERKQLEKWVTEIETRVGHRESESQAEINRLSKRLQAATEEANAAQQRLQTLASGGNASESTQQVAVEKLTEQLAALREKLQTAEEENERLLKCPVTSDDQVDLAAKLQAAEDELMALKVEISRERAEVARRHAELEVVRDKLEIQLQSPRSENNGESRIRAMREHLREIHVQEENAKKDKRQTGLSGRITNLLTRLR